MPLLLFSQTRVIVTHSLWFLSQVDEIFVVEDGKICEHGSFSELMAKNQALAELMKTYDATKDSAIKVGVKGEVTIHFQVYRICVNVYDMW